MNHKSSALFLGVACTLMLAAGLVPGTVSAQPKAASAKTLQIGYVLLRQRLVPGNGRCGGEEPEDRRADAQREGRHHRRGAEV